MYVREHEKYAIVDYKIFYFGKIFFCVFFLGKVLAILLIIVTRFFFICEFLLIVIENIAIKP